MFDSPEKKSPAPGYGSTEKLTHYKAIKAFKKALCEYDTMEEEGGSAMADDLADQLRKLERENQDLRVEAKLATVEERLDAKIDAVVQEIRGMRSDVDKRLTSVEAEQKVMAERVSSVQREIGSVWKHVGLIAVGAVLIIGVIQWALTNRLMDVSGIIRLEEQMKQVQQHMAKPSAQAPAPADKSK